MTLLLGSNHPPPPYILPHGPPLTWSSPECQVLNEQDGVITKCVFMALGHKKGQKTLPICSRLISQMSFVWGFASCPLLPPCVMSSRSREVPNRLNELKTHFSLIVSLRISENMAVFICFVLQWVWKFQTITILVTRQCYYFLFICRRGTRCSNCFARHRAPPPPVSIYRKSNGWYTRQLYSYKFIIALYYNAREIGLLFMWDRWRWASHFIVHNSHSYWNGCE